MNLSINGTNFRHSHSAKRSSQPQNLSYNQYLNASEGFSTKSQKEQLNETLALPDVDCSFPQSCYPIRQFRPLLPSKCFVTNPFYTLSKFKRHLREQNQNCDILSTFKTIMDTRRINKSQSIQRSEASLDARSIRMRTQRSLTLSARRQNRQSVQVINHTYQNDKLMLLQQDDNTAQLSQLLNLRKPFPEPAQDLQNLYLGEIECDNENGESTRKPIIFAVKAMNEPLKENYQAPNFPFNLNYMISHLKAQRSIKYSKERIVPNFDYKDMSQAARPFTSRVYKKRSNSKGRQFYTDCVKQSENLIVPQRPLQLRPNTAEQKPKIHLKDRTIRNEVAMLSNIFIKHSPLMKPTIQIFINQSKL